MTVDTRDDFREYKREYEIYGTHTIEDKYNNEQAVIDDHPRCTVYTMWNPLIDALSIAEYGQDISNMYYAIIYDDPGIQHGDVVTIRDEQYEVVGIKHYHTHTRIEIKKKVGQ